MCFCFLFVTQIKPCPSTATYHSKCYYISYTHNVTAYFIARTISTIALCTNLIIFTYHIYNILPCITKKPLSYMQKVSLFSLSVIISYNFEYCRLLYVILINESTASCTINIKYAVGLYAIQKMSIYLFSLERLFCVFRGSPDAFPKLQIYTTRIIWFGIIIFYIIIVTLFVGGKPHPMNFKKYGCITDFSYWIYILGSI